MSETVDLLDEDGRIIGTIEKGEAHATGAWHRGAHVWIITPSGLIVQRRAERKQPYPGRWDASAAGHVGAGETPKEAAIRETSEELGISLEKGQLEELFTVKQVFEMSGQRIDREHVTVFFVLLREVPLVRLERREVAEYDTIATETFMQDVSRDPEAWVPHPYYASLIELLKDRLDAAHAGR